MKNMKRWAVVVMAAMMLTGCGNKETVTSQGAGTREEQRSTGQSTSQGGAGGLWNGQGPEITSYEELEAYQADRMEDIVAAFTDSGVEYEMTPNQCYLCGTEKSYKVLEREYEIVQIAYSMYNYEQNQLNTVIDFEYEFHPEKGVASDDKYIQLLSALIHTTENKEIKEKFPTSDTLVSEISRCIGNREDRVVFEAQNCRLKIEVDGSAKYILGFVNVENETCNIPRIEPTYKEFASLDEYKAYQTANLRADLDVDMDFYVNRTATAYGIDNHFAIRYSLGWYHYESKESVSEARDIMVKLLEYLDSPDIDIEKAADEWISRRMIKSGGSLDYIFSREWFDATPLVNQYPFMQGDDVVIPIKVEGLLN